MEVIPHNKFVSFAIDCAFWLQDSAWKHPLGFVALQPTTCIWVSAHFTIDHVGMHQPVCGHLFRSHALWEMQWLSLDGYALAGYLIIGCQHLY